MTSQICHDCKERLYPRDPSKPMYIEKAKRDRFRGVDFAGYLRPICEGCSNHIPDDKEIAVAYRELRVPAWSHKQWDLVFQLRAEVRHLNNKVTELSNKKRKARGRY